MTSSKPGMEERPCESVVAYELSGSSPRVREAWPSVEILPLLGRRDHAYSLSRGTDDWEHDPDTLAESVRMTSAGHASLPPAMSFREYATAF